MTIKEYLKEGLLDEAVKAAAQDVKQSPSDEAARTLFVELLCVKGEFERADAQLTALISIKPELSFSLSVWRQLIKAAQVRQDVFSLLAKPDVIDTPTTSISKGLDLLVALKEGDDSILQRFATEFKNEVADAQPQVSINGQSPQSLRNLDDVLGHVMEVLGTNGKYFWVDFSQIESLHIEKPTRIIDILWRKASICLANGSEGEVYIPSTYPLLGDAEAVLGHKTEWLEQNGIYRGLGLQTWLFGDEEISINDIESLDASVKNVVERSAEA